jgi:hypothetical protein
VNPVSMPAKERWYCITCQKSGSTEDGSFHEWECRGNAVYQTTSWYEKILLTVFGSAWVGTVMCDRINGYKRFD